MKKILSLIFVLLCCTACTPNLPHRSEPMQFVTEVTVHYRYGDITLQRRYTESKKIDKVLFYLYGLSPYGTPPEDPEQLWGDSCQIILLKSDGSRRIYRQQGSRYLSVDNRPWQKINENHAARLPALLLGTESDL